MNECFLFDKYGSIIDLNVGNRKLSFFVVVVVLAKSARIEMKREIDAC